MGGHYSGGKYYTYNKQYYDNRKFEDKEKKTVILDKGSYKKFFQKDLALREKKRHLGEREPFYPYLNASHPFKEEESVSSEQVDGDDILSMIEQDVHAAGQVSRSRHERDTSDTIADK